MRRPFECGSNTGSGLTHRLLSFSVHVVAFLRLQGFVEVGLVDQTFSRKAETRTGQWTASHEEAQARVNRRAKSVLTCHTTPRCDINMLETYQIPDLERPPRWPPQPQSTHSAYVEMFAGAFPCSSSCGRVTRRYTGFHAQGR